MREGLGNYRFRDSRDPSFPNALCASGEHDPDTWHIEALVQVARKICFRCKDIAACADWGTTRLAPKEGVLGGLTAENRDKIRRARQIQEWK